jgi:hypothetical protein
VFSISLKCREGVRLPLFVSPATDSAQQDTFVCVCVCSRIEIEFELGDACFGLWRQLHVKMNSYRVSIVGNEYIPGKVPRNIGRIVPRSQTQHCQNQSINHGDLKFVVAVNKQPTGRHPHQPHRNNRQQPQQPRRVAHINRNTQPAHSSVTATNILHLVVHSQLAAQHQIVPCILLYIQPHDAQVKANSRSAPHAGERPRTGTQGHVDGQRARRSGRI